MFYLNQLPIFVKKDLGELWFFLENSASGIRRGED
jgi:hypothetical protein